MISWDPRSGHVIIHRGPTSTTEAADAALATVHAVPEGGVLPDAPTDWPAPGRGPHQQTHGTWGGLVTPAGGLHPMIRLHAAQTFRGVIDAPRRALTAHPDLMDAAITGLGLDARYGAGLWLLRDDQEPAPRASAGRDWLAIMALPWMPAGADLDGRPLAPGWVTPDRLQWRLWSDPVPAGSVSAVLAHEYGYIPPGSASASLPRNYGPPGPEFAAIRRPRTHADRHRPPYLTPFDLPRDVPAVAR
jgi:hypothetical protein